MTPEEELKGLNRLIRQYETVYRTTPDPDQREPLARQLQQLGATASGFRGRAYLSGSPFDSSLVRPVP